MTTSDTLSCERVAVRLKALLAFRGKKAWEEYSSESDSEMMHSVPCSNEGNVDSDAKSCQGCGRKSEETYKFLLLPSKTLNCRSCHDKRVERKVSNKAWKKMVRLAMGQKQWNPTKVERMERKKQNCALMSLGNGCRWTHEHQGYAQVEDESHS